MGDGAVDLKQFLSETPFFGGLSDSSLNLLISFLIERRFDDGATIFREGDPGRSLYTVRSGSLVVSRQTDSSGSTRIASLQEGDFFGEMTLIEMQNRSATVTATSETVLYELTAQALYSYYKQDIHGYVIVLQNVNRELSRRLRKADDRTSFRS